MLSLLVQRCIVKQEQSNWASAAWVSSAGENRPTRQIGTATHSWSLVSVKPAQCPASMCFSSQAVLFFPVEALPSLLHPPPSWEQPTSSPYSGEWSSCLPPGRQHAQHPNFKDTKPSAHHHPIPILPLIFPPLIQRCSVLSTIKNQCACSLYFPFRL